MGVRQIFISIEDFTEDFLGKRSSLLKLIENPYSQLNLNVRERYESKSEEVVDWKISLRSLCIDIRDFVAFRPLLDHLQHLTLSFEGDDTVDSEDSEDSEDSDEEELTFPLIGEVLDEVCKLPGLKELNFDSLPDLHQLPVIRYCNILSYMRQIFLI